MSPDEQAIHQVHATWIHGVNAGELKRLLSLTTDDVVFLNPGQTPFGREGFAENFSSAHERMLVRCISELEEVVVVGDVAYTRSRDTLNVAPRAGGDVRRLEGYRITVYRRDASGHWLLARDAHTLTPVDE